MSDSRHALRVLLVDDNAEDAEILRIALEESASTSLRGAAPVAIDVTHTETLRDTLDLLVSAVFDLILLDLDLPDSAAMHTYTRAALPSRGTPIVAMTDLDDAGLAVRVVCEGAQDVVVKSELDRGHFARIVRHSMARHKLRLAQQEVMFLDPVTDLYTKQGFLYAADRDMALARHLGRRFGVALVRIHSAGDPAHPSNWPDTWIEAARVFPPLFGETALIGRLGEGEIAAASLDPPVETWRASLALASRDLAARIQSGPRSFGVRCEFGVTEWSGECSTSDLLHRAASSMWENVGAIAARN